MLYTIYEDTVFYHLAKNKDHRFSIKVARAQRWRTKVCWCELMSHLYNFRQG